MDGFDFNSIELGVVMHLWVEGENAVDGSYGMSFQFVMDSIALSHPFLTLVSLSRRSGLWTLVRLGLGKGCDDGGNST